MSTFTDFWKKITKNGQKVYSYKNKCRASKSHNIKCTIGFTTFTATGMTVHGSKWIPDISDNLSGFDENPDKWNLNRDKEK